MKTRILTLALIAVCSISTSLSQVVYSSTYNKPSEPDGTKHNPFEISTKEQLLDFAKELESSNGKGQYWKLTASIDMECGKKNPWRPISLIDRQFEGSFDGNGHTIKGLFNTSGNYLGLFGYIGKNGQVSNLTIEGLFAGSEYVGGIAAMNYGTITNCQNIATIGGNSRIGGIAGYSCGTVANCSNMGEIIGKNSVGGIVGFNYNGYIFNSFNIGGIQGGANTAGIAGNNGFDNIKTCYTVKGSVMKGKGGENGIVVELAAIKSINFIAELDKGSQAYNNTYMGGSDNTAIVKACGWKLNNDSIPVLDLDKK